MRQVRARRPDPPHPLGRLPFTALDINSEHVGAVRRFGNKVYFSDASRLDLLIAAKTDGEGSFALAIGDVEASLCRAETVRCHFPHVKLFDRAHNRFHAYRLMDLGAELIEPETFLGSLELAKNVLQALDIQEWEAAQTVARFKAHDDRTLERQHTPSATTRRSSGDAYINRPSGVYLHKGKQDSCPAKRAHYRSSL